MKLWSGRFTTDTDYLVEEFNASIDVDQRLYPEDIAGSLAHAEMLAEQHIIPVEDSQKIITSLKEILAEIESGKISFCVADEDIHMAIEKELTARIHESGKKLHTARSRNDQVAVDLKLYLKKEIKEVQEQLHALLFVLVEISEKHLETILPAYTHLQRAQPSTLAHVFMAYAQMFRRDVSRLADCLARLDESPLGAGALCGTTFPIDRAFTAEKLGFGGVTENSLDSVADRDFVLELLSIFSILMTHLSRFSEEIILWCSWEFRFVECSDAYSTGSSIMPQKKNPDVAELVRGKTGQVYGSLMGMLTVMKGLPLAYNKDMQEDKVHVFAALDTVKMCVPVFTNLLKTIKILPENMRKAANEGFINATDCADYLVKKGIAFREAHEITGHLVAQCISEGKTLESLSLEEYKKESEQFAEDIFDAILLENCVNRRNSAGGPAKESVQQQIERVKKFVGG